jgi:hypothetical protein
MMRAATMLWALLAIIAGTGLFLLKYQVQAAERHLHELRQDIVGGEQSIRVLKAEWNYLDNQTRLSDLAEHHLVMRPMHANQIVAIEDIPMIGGPIFQPPGMTAKKGHAAELAKKPVAPLPKVPPSIRTMPAKLSKPTVTPGRSPEVASTKIRP